MVLITDDRDGGSAVRVRQLQQSPKAGAQVHPVTIEEPQSVSDDEYLGSFDLEEGEVDYFVEYDEFAELPDTRSITSDDSFYPPHDVFADSERSTSSERPGLLSFFQACSTNNAAVVRFKIRHGVGEDEVRETDKNNRTALIVACYQGYIDVVMALSECPHLDVNWQDTEGNTALITAGQAGHVMISNYLLNYFCDVDLERRNCHGLTALMKAAMQGRVECVRALVMAGADTEARDFRRGLTPREWAWFTGRYDTAWAMTRLMARPCPRQICQAYSPEWPQLAVLVAKAATPRSYFKRMSDVVRNALNFSNVTNPEDGGVLDHLVTVTTGLASPFVVLACRTVCPGSPPQAGKRCGAVPEIVRRQRTSEPCPLELERPTGHQQLLHSAGPALRTPRPPPEPRFSPQRTQTPPPGRAPGHASRRASLLPLHSARRSSVCPGPPPPPKVRLSKAPTPTYIPESARGKGNRAGGGKHLLQVPKWRYKELKEDRRRAEEVERRRAEEEVRRRAEEMERRRAEEVERRRTEEVERRKAEEVERRKAEEVERGRMKVLTNKHLTAAMKDTHPN